jgi:outer membrane receptor protein involved in Fe transport
MRPKFVHCLLVPLALLSTTPLWAGILGTVRGIVHDAQHRPIPGASVILRARLSDWERRATTDAAGSFSIDVVPAGEYTIRITHEGFRDFEQPLTVAADTAPLLHFPMQLATVTERIEVSAAPDQTYPDSSSVPVSLNREDLSTTPGARRATSLDFITNFVPGAYMVHDQVHIRGGHQVSWLVGGVPVPNTNISSNVGPQFDPKDIETIEITRGGYSAEYGDRTYAVLNVVPRSGFERNREMEIAASYGSYHSTDSQVSFGDHTSALAYYLSLSANRSDVGLQPPEANILHNLNNGVSGFASVIFNATSNDQLRLVTSARADFFQIPNTLDQQLAGIRDVQRERDAFLNFSWVHTSGPGVLLTVAPFYHWNHAAYDGGASDPLITTDHRDSHYAGGLTSLAVTRGRHNARFGLYGFAQRDYARFGAVDNGAGSGAFPFQSEKPSGYLTALFAEEQFRAADWLTLNGGLRLTHFEGLLVENHASPRLGAALRIPRLKWVLRAFYGRYYQAPPLSTVARSLLQPQGFDFLPLRGERDEQHEFGLTIPVRGWTLDVSTFLTHARNFFDHEVLGNSNIFFPVTIERARIHGWEFTAHSPAIGRRVRVYLTYSHQFVEGAGGISGGLTDFAPPEEGFFFLDHDQRDTLNAGFHVPFPWHAWASGNLSFGSGFLDGDGPAHLPSHTTFDLALGKSFGGRFTVTLAVQNIANSHYLIDNSNTFGGTHFNYPRQFTGEVRYRFHL